MLLLTTTLSLSLSLSLCLYAARGNLNSLGVVSSAQQISNPFYLICLTSPLPPPLPPFLFPAPPSPANTASTVQELTVNNIWQHSGLIVPAHL